MTIGAFGGSASAVSGSEVQEEKGVVYLTFDDGPHPLFTPLILELLERHGARAGTIEAIIAAYERTRELGA